LTENTSASQVKRIYSLDILRGLAIALVLIRHAPVESAFSDNIFKSAFHLLYQIGWTGVDLFFVLSGYLISGLLFKEFDRTGKLDIPRFWLRRGFKIWPSYFFTYGLLVLASFAAKIVSGKPERAITQVREELPNFVFIQNYFSPDIRWPHSWSIAVEEHFYFALPILLYLLFIKNRKQDPARQNKFKGFLLLGMLLCAAVLAMRLFLVSTGQTAWQSYYYPTHFRMDSLCCGVLIGYLHRYHATWFKNAGKFWPYLLLLVPLGLSLSIFYPLESSTATFTYGFTIFYIVYGGLVLLAANYPDFGKTGAKILVWPSWALATMGVYSYTIYLAHSVVYKLGRLDLLRNALKDSIWADTFLTLLFWALSIGIGILISHLIERPFLILRDKWCPRVAPQANLQAAEQPT